MTMIDARGQIPSPDGSSNERGPKSEAAKLYTDLQASSLHEPNSGFWMAQIPISSARRDREVFGDGPINTPIALEASKILRVPTTGLADIFDHRMFSGARASDQLLDLFVRGLLTANPLRRHAIARKGLKELYVTPLNGGPAGNGVHDWKESLEYEARPYWWDKPGKREERAEKDYYPFNKRSGKTQENLLEDGNTQSQLFEVLVQSQIDPETARANLLQMPDLTRFVNDFDSLGHASPTTKLLRIYAELKVYGAHSERGMMAGLVYGVFQDRSGAFNPDTQEWYSYYGSYHKGSPDLTAQLIGVLIQAQLYGSNTATGKLAVLEARYGSSEEAGLWRHDHSPEPHDMSYVPHATDQLLRVAALREIEAGFAVSQKVSAQAA